MDDQPDAGLHQGMAVEAHHRVSVGDLLYSGALGIGGRNMSGIGALLVPEIDVLISVLSVVKGICSV